ncbi:hypothetical protein [Kutzneria albida]|uniref:ATP synthase protein I n=1 Tax=Kutzneria albida DSM 43870 TaxID=1449976 RepID=W5WK67_9PSEU|nr:hypothetical protein [Kutzneria albida]AHI00972.1 hypothetical protein KALB_7614 [Kutzneria albida DSM 43870]
MTTDEKSLPPLDSIEGTVLRYAHGMRRYALLPTSVVAVLAIAVCSVIAGLAGAIAAVLGSVVIIGGGMLVLFVMRRTAAQPPMVVLAAALATYMGKFVFLLAFGLAFKGTSLFDSKLFAYSVLATLVVWTVGEVIGFRKTKVLTLITGATGPKS